MIFFRIEFVQKVNVVYYMVIKVCENCSAKWFFIDFFLFQYRINQSITYNITRKTISHRFLFFCANK